jgi:hypothetical protein
MRGRLVAGVLGALAAAQAGCLVLPVRSAPGVTGRVIDASTRKPLAGAIVVAAFDGRHGDLLPDRDHIGHAEVRTDATGRFAIPRHFAPGPAVWPIYRGETRVVSVFAEGHRCPTPRAVRAGERVVIALAAAADAADQRESCRPVAARAGETPTYMAAWRALFDEHETESAEADRRRVEQVLAARATLGFGENCEGTVVDLALSPDGRRVATATRDGQGSVVHVVDLARSGVVRSVRAQAARHTPPRRLAWTTATQLVLWEPAELLRAAPGSDRGSADVEVIWRGAPLPAPPVTPRSPAPPAAPAALPIEPEDRYDDGATRWAGRGFSLARRPDPVSGLGQDELRIVSTAGDRHAIDLPGEACGPSGAFGRPQYRITADGDHAVDLRFLDGGCRAVWIDLESGAWKRLDASGSARAECRSERRIPPSTLAVALHGYLREVEASLDGAGLELGRSYALRIEPSGKTQAETRDPDGRPRLVSVAPFPVRTPLRVIQISNVSSLDGRRPPAQAPAPQPPRDEREQPEPL